MRYPLYYNYTYDEQGRRKKVGKDVDHIDLAHQDHTVMLTAATRKHVPGMLTDVVSAEPMYIRKGSSYVLEYMLMDSTGRSMLLDAKNID